MNTIRHILMLLLVWFGCVKTLYAQLERKLLEEEMEEELIFHAPRHINLATVEALEKNTLHFAIMHTFGTVDNGPRNLWGLDNGANILLNFEYGLTDRFSLGLSRQSMDKFYNLYFRHHVLRQTQNNRMPFSLSLMAGMGLNTSDYDFLPDPGVQLQERFSYVAQVMVARKFSEKLSLQLSPMWVYFNSPLPVYQIEGTQKSYLALGLSSKYKMTGKTSLTGQWIPNLNNGLTNNVGLGIDVEAGGHVFQMYFVTSPALSDQYLLAGGNGRVGEKFRLGFNVNRLFHMGR
ncbi:DUF5777 family beta-barrel protein [Cecembia rubra]|uniref:DUF5777 domain-containing protein n=1 Tax=Cecembia rubra TaxID=1485585 RepID=A0A2P8E1L9_9BACT|nr:DUF5777 family beta-barrel protein [Cecembia rubra]PSL03364.1 hypothetical protein CLV48_10782 [Cecembia rubra]